MSTNSVTLHRVLKASPEKVYRAFTDAHAMASWIPPYGFLCIVHQLDAKPGGTYKMTFTNFTTGNGHSFGGKYLEIKPNEFLKYTDVLMAFFWLEDAAINKPMLTGIQANPTNNVPLKRPLPLTFRRGTINKEVATSTGAAIKTIVAAVCRCLPFFR